MQLRNDRQLRKLTYSKAKRVRQGNWKKIPEVRSEKFVRKERKGESEICQRKSTRDWSGGRGGDSVCNVRKPKTPRIRDNKKKGSQISAGG